MGVNDVGFFLVIRYQLVLERDVGDVNCCHIEENARCRIPFRKRVRGDNADAVLVVVY